MRWVWVFAVASLVPHAGWAQTKEDTEAVEEVLGVNDIEQGVAAVVAGNPDDPVHSLATDFIETRGVTRLHLNQNLSASSPEGAFSGDPIYAMEARASFAVSDSFSLTTAIPFGVFSGGGETKAFFGNLTAGASYGTSLAGASNVALGVGLDLGFPTSPGTESFLESAGRGILGIMHGYDVQLYVPQLFSARVRGYGRYELKPISLEAELGLVPGGVVGENGGFVMLLSGKVRGSGRFGMVEPFVEIGGARQLAGTGQINPPLLFGPGVRLHIGFFRPAFMVKLNAVESKFVTFNLDLAGIIVPAPEAEDDFGTRGGLEDDGFL